MLFAKEDYAPLKIKPLYKWAGGKRRLWKFYKNVLIKHEGQTIYVEPFFGGGAVFCEVHHLFDHIIINDVNGELIGIYKAIQQDVDKFIEEISKLSKAYLKIQGKENRKAHYYKLREAYWKNPTSELLYFLMQLSFNGVWQTMKESNGLFATPAGKLNEAKEQDIYDEENIRNWHKILQEKVEICNGSYEHLNIPDNALVYLDPPYRDSFTTYETEFDDNEQRKLIEWAKSIKSTKKNTTLFESNRCVEGEHFFEELIPNGEFTYIDIIYTAGRKKIVGENQFAAKSAQEVLIKF